MIAVPTVDEIDVSQQRCLLREDFNVPMDNGVIIDDSRIERALPGIQSLLARGAAVILCSHLGRPTEGEFDAQFSLAPVAQRLSEKLGVNVPLISDWLDGVDVPPGNIVLCENVRFNPGEKNNDEALSQRMAALCDIFIMDAFATAHRAQASTVGVAQWAKKVCVGPLMCQELTALQTALDQPKRPLLAIVGGAKVSTKIQLLESLLSQVQVLFVGGGIANTFLKAQGYNVGQSLCEPDFVTLAQSILQQAEQRGVKIPLPVDVTVADTFSASATPRVCAVDQVKDHEMILDVGPETAASYQHWMDSAKTIIWNGPVGVFEFSAFAKGSLAMGRAIAESKAYSIAGGGDTVAALVEFELTEGMSYISTGGGAFLSYLQGELLPALAVIKQKVSEYEKTS